MKSEMLSQEKNMVSIKVTFDQEEFAAQVDKACSELARKVSIPGFRKGHIPRKILEMRLGKEAIRAEALDKVLPETIDQVVQDYELDLIDEPRVEVDSMDEGVPVTVNLSFEVSPDVVLPALSEIQVDRLVAAVSDDMVEKTVEDLRMQASTLSAVEGRAAEAGDVVDISYHTIISGEGTQDERHGPDTTSIDLGQTSVREEIRAALAGKRKGEEAVAEVVVADDHSDKDLAGKTMRYEMTVTDVKERTLPDMNPEFFGKVLQMETTTEEEFREGVRARLLERLQGEYQARAEYDAVESITGLSALEVPETLIRRQERAMIKEDEERAKRARNMTLEQFLEASSLSREEYEKNIRSQAETIVRRSLVLDKVAEEMHVTVEKEDFEQEMAALASAYQIDAERLVKSLFKDEARMVEMANKIKYRKTVAAIMKTVQISEKAADHGADVQEGHSEGGDDA